MTLGRIAPRPPEGGEHPLNDDTLDDYLVPQDPMDLLQCESCQ